jgi:hypothetical protein
MSLLELVLWGGFTCESKGALIAALSSVASRHVHPTVHGNPDYHTLSASALPRLSEPGRPHLMTLSIVQLANRLDNVIGPVT